MNSVINEYPKDRGRDIYNVLTIPSLSKRIVLSNYHANAIFVVDESHYDAENGFSLGNYNKQDLAQME